MGGVTRSPEIAPSPPVTFPVYGLEASWSGLRWLDGFGDRIGDEVRRLDLAHQSAETGALILVESCARPLTDAQAADFGEPPLQSVATAASVMVVNMTLPDSSLPRPPGFLTALVANAMAHSREYARWPLVSWRVDGADADARIWRFAGGWAAFSAAAEGVYLAVAGSAGTDPEGLALARLQDGHAYHVDLDGPSHTGLMTASKAAARAGDRTFVVPPDWHADHLRLMGGRNS